MGAYAPISQQKDLQMLNISTLDKSCQEAFKNKFVIFYGAKFSVFFRDNTI